MTSGNDRRAPRRQPGPADRSRLPALRSRGRAPGHLTLIALLLALLAGAALAGMFTSPTAEAENVDGCHGLVSYRDVNGVTHTYRVPLTSCGSPGSGTSSVAANANANSATSGNAGVGGEPVRSAPLTEIAAEGATELWFPIGRGDCDMRDEERPWTWAGWTPPAPERCGWLSIPDPRAALEASVGEAAFKLYAVVNPSPDIQGRAGLDRPRGRSIDLAVWALYRRTEELNGTARVQGPYESPITVCLPGEDDQAIHGFDEANGQWVELESVEAEREGHICGLHAHDLGLLVVAGD